MTMLDFTCEYCGKVNPANAWNQATIEQYDGDCETLPETPEDTDTCWQACVFTCPECLADATPTDLDVEKVEKLIMEAFLIKYNIDRKDEAWLRSLV